MSYDDEVKSEATSKDSGLIKPPSITDKIDAIESTQINLKEIIDLVEERFSGVLVEDRGPEKMNVDRDQARNTEVSIVSERLDRIIETQNFMCRALRDILRRTDL
jgi:hypothetical protein